MAHQSPDPDDRLKSLISMLPEVYQPIYGDARHVPFLRECEDRLATIIPVIAAFGDSALRIVDLGCAQGYFALSLKARFPRACVTGVDKLEANVELCRELALRCGLDVEFVAADIRNQALPTGEAPLIVLAMSVLHHLCSAQGWESARSVISAIAVTADAAIVEIAPASEGLDWTAELPDADQAWLEPFAFVRKIGEHHTHVSALRRPLYFCSNRRFLAANAVYGFDQFVARSHPGAMPESIIGRRYFMSEGLTCKRFSLSGRYADHNREEMRSEVIALRELGVPRLLAYDEAPDAAYLVREHVPGRALVDCATDLPAGDRLRAFGEILGDLQRFEAVGLQHFDIRPWNLLIAPSGAVHLIDFGALRRERARAPYEDALSLLRWIWTGEWSEFAAYQRNLYPQWALPLFDHVQRTPLPQLSFASMRELLPRNGVGECASWPDAAIGAESSEESLAVRLREKLRDNDGLREWATNAELHAERVVRELHRTRVRAEEFDTRLSELHRSAERQLADGTARAQEAERYALSLAGELERGRARAEEAERYALSLAGELERGRARADRAEGYARSLELELANVRPALEEAQQRCLDVSEALGGLEAQVRHIRKNWGYRFAVAISRRRLSP